MIANEFEFFAPRDIEEALALLRQHGHEAKVLAGGMSLVPVMRMGLAHPSVVLSMNKLSMLDYVEERAGSLHIGALTRHAGLGRNTLIAQHAPLVAAAARAIGDVQIRNRGTLGGSLAHADPAADYPSAMLALGARFHIRSQDGERTVDAGEFFIDVMTTALAPDELLTEIEIPTCPAGTGYAHERLRRVEGAFPIVIASVVIEAGGGRARMGLGGIGSTPVLLDIAQHLGSGTSNSTVEAIGAAAYDAAAGALDDLNGSAPYRRAMARLYSQRAVRAALDGRTG